MEQPKKNVTFCFRLSDELLTRFAAAARRDGRKLSDWMRRQCELALAEEAH